MVGTIIFGEHPCGKDQQGRENPSGQQCDTKLGKRSPRTRGDEGMKETAECGNPLYWHNCYSGTYDLIHGDSMAHPAKMSPALRYRILRHLQELGLAKEEDTTI